MAHGRLASLLAPVLGPRTVMWLFVPIVAGFLGLGVYERSPGERGVAARVSPDLETRSLYVFVHPGCPCTRASIEQLDRILTQVRGVEAEVSLFFFRPKDARHGFAGAAIEERVRSIPGVRIIDDPDGAMARRFGIRTSGHALLIESDGEVLFDGGLTGSRGHAGDNESSAMLRDLLLQRREANEGVRPVFGCAIRGDA